MKTITSIRRSLFALLALLPALPAAAQSFQPIYDVTKAAGSAPDAPNVLVYGARAGDKLGSSVRAGDLNGDGVDDLIVGAQAADVGSPLRPNAGAVYVWFGRGALAGTKDAAGTMGTAPDLTIRGKPSTSTLSENGLSASAAGGALGVGDVNGDGTTDLILSARELTSNGRGAAGEAYIIFGRKSPATFPAVLDMTLQGSAGADVTVYGAVALGYLTVGANAVDDLNGDGTADLVLGAPNAALPGPRTLSGIAYVIFGRKSPAIFPPTLDLAIVGNAGANVRIQGATASEQLSPGRTLLGDVNGDGTDDLLLGGVGRPDGHPGGVVYIILGRTSPASFPATLDMAVQGSSGADVTIAGATAGDQLTSFAGLKTSDVNDDGIADLLLGASQADGPAEGRTDSGEAYIVFGRTHFPATLDLAVQGNGGADVTLYGAGALNQLPDALMAGDVNGDGTADLLLGLQAAGKAYVVFGRKSPATFPVTLDLNVQGSTGADLTINGPQDGVQFSGAMTGGDLNGDGITDLVLGATAGLGRAYIVLGRQSPNTFPPVLDLLVDGVNSVTLIGGGDHLTRFGALAVGDFNGDGTADLLLGANLADGPSDGRMNAGEAYVLYGIGASVAPEIAVEQPPGTPLLDGTSSVGFGTLNPGNSSGAKTFTIKNTGAVALSITGVSVTGGQAGEFAVDTTGMLASVPAGQQTTFSIVFSPAVGGPRGTALHILSNDTDEATFDIALAGTGTGNPASAWRQLHFGTSENTGNAADTADPDGDGITNLLERATLTNPLLPNPPPIQITLAGNQLGFTYTRSKAALADVTFAVQWNDDLVADSWSRDGVTETILSDDGTVQQVRASLPTGGARRFVQLSVTTSGPSL